MVRRPPTRLSDAQPTEPTRRRIPWSPVNVSRNFFFLSSIKSSFVLDMTISILNEDGDELNPQGGPAPKGIIVSEPFWCEINSL